MNQTGSQEGKTFIVTGGTTGIGFQTARALAAMGGRVILTGRSEKSAEDAAKRISNEFPGAAVKGLAGDFAVQDQVRRLAAEILSLCPRIDCLINNAGLFSSKLETTAGGIELTFAVNHLGYFLLTQLLLDRIRESAPARIVNVSSAANFGGRIVPESFRPGKNFSYNGIRAYRQSKLANVLFTYELARKLEGTGITANCLHPGTVRTHIARKHSSGLPWWGWTLAMPFMISEEKGADTQVWLATSPEVSGLSGKYFRKRKAVPSDRHSYNMELAGALWRESEKLCGIGDNEN